MKRIVFWFDPISPFAYLAFERLPEALEGCSYEVQYRPLLLAGLLSHWGQKGPAEVEPKRAWTFRHVAWLAHTYQIPIDTPATHPFNPLALLRLATAADSRPEIVHAIFRFVWQDGRLPDTPLEWFELTSVLGLPNADAHISASRVKDDLRATTDDAIARGVFGVPTIIIDDRLFWGLDATDMALDYLQGAPVFSSDAFARVREIPAGAERTS